MPASLIVFMGLIAGGKSTLARAFAAEFSLPCHNTDVIRKELAGFEPDSRQGSSLNQGIYSPGFTRRTYDALRDHAEKELEMGRTVVLDGSYQQRAERDLLAKCAARYGAPVYFILCRCDDEETRRRLDLRAQDPHAVSDGTWDIYVQQKKKQEAPNEIPADHLLILDTAQPISRLLSLLKEKFASLLS